MKRNFLLQWNPMPIKHQFFIYIALTSTFPLFLFSGVSKVFNRNIEFNQSFAETLSWCNIKRKHKNNELKICPQILTPSTYQFIIISKYIFLTYLLVQFCCCCTIFWAPLLVLYDLFRRLQNLLPKLNEVVGYQ